LKKEILAINRFIGLCRKWRLEAATTAVKMTALHICGRQAISFFVEI
jgi:hypothetical protein